MTTALTQNEKDTVQSTFNHLDTDKDGLIDNKEIATILRVLGQNPTELELRDIEDKCNQAGTSLNYDTVVKLIEEIGLKSLEEEEEELRLAFRAIDRDDSGTITKAELKRYLRLVGEQMSEEEVDEIMDLSDLNKDGVINYQEFITVMAAHIM